MKKLFFILLVTSFSAFGQIPCENGLADNTYPCNQTILMGHLTPAELLAPIHHGFYLNDLWGWTDSKTGDEYAIVGLTDGVSFVRITDPTHPVMLGKLNETPPPGSGRVFHGQSSWRDIKVFKDHAFIVSDLNYDHGMQIFDLTKLRELTTSVGNTLKPDFTYTGVASSHNLAINEETGYAYIVGSNQSSNPSKWCDGLHIVDINDPKNPVFVTCYTGDEYSHDAQVVIYNGPDTDYQGKEICFGANEDTFTIFDVDDKSNITIISRNGYANSVYTHQGWLTEDHQYYLMNDELDEQAFGFNPKTFIWDVRDLDKPRLIGFFYNEEPSIDHNLYIRDGLVYESNYFSGLRIHDLSRVEYGTLREVAFFDTYPGVNHTQYGGSWSNYPFFESGNIIVSDMNTGLFILRTDIKEGVLKHPLDSVTINEPHTFEVEAADPNATYQWQKFSGNKFQNLQESDLFEGTKTASMTTTVIPSQAANVFRCVITDSENRIHYSFPSLKAKVTDGSDVLGIEGTIKVFPNPATDYLVVPVKTPLAYGIYSISGAEVIHGQVTPADPVVRLETLPEGQYILKTNTQGFRFVIKR